MNTATKLHPDDVRAAFSRALSDMYKTEVPQYGTLLELVADINAEVIRRDGPLSTGPHADEERQRLGVERHGAIRLGTAEELATMRRLFAVMGMVPVGYYDLSVAGVPVHATAFRTTDEASLRRNPFRVFTSLLRLDLIDDVALRERAAAILERRDIYTARCRALIAIAEREGGLDAAQAAEFVAQALETFRWHHDATVDADTYRELRSKHPLIADVVCFKGPHINHLTPRVLDIDAAQAAMHGRGMKAKDSIEGPPRRGCPILLRQTSFLALEEPIRFVGAQGDGTHTARFGEIEQRGCALTPAGRERYDALLQQSREAGKTAPDKGRALAETFAAFPDDLATLHSEGLAYVRWQVPAERLASRERPAPGQSAAELLAGGWLAIEPLIYEDFLPVSAAGIFRSNLGSEGQAAYDGGGNRGAFERDLGAPVADEFALYEATEQQSLQAALARLAGAEATSTQAA
ncbi:VOC family protein [Xylophilus sp. GOD-11R]|uniref:2-oxoadipate dioxygenase/decarboxylase HglS n=1 Tax=Xylophilus sp. GOD-11R TaxID=3089814 RepID=UPI00298C5BB9|nr:DUF1338 family protein [Xylophilus sp. GOD-11R]WPB55613.1 DUF1338 family protein [Xylophilus sp. GOD-11R]